MTALCDTGIFFKEIAVCHLGRNDDNIGIITVQTWCKLNTIVVDVSRSFICGKKLIIQPSYGWGFFMANQ